MPTLEVKNLSMRFGGIQALQDVAFEVPVNAFVGLMGPNGAGKTTVINCISGVYEPERGQILFDGQDLLKLSGHDVLDLGISRTFQDLNFFNQISDMLIVDYLRLGQFNTRVRSLLSQGLRFKQAREYERETKKNARQVLEFFREIRERLEPTQIERGYPDIHGREGFPDLIDVEYQPIGILSFAWRRRLDLARALVSRPKLLLLDEPAQGLAPSEIENLGKTLKLIQTELGISALVVEHNVAILSEVSDKIIVMAQGKPIAEGRPEIVCRDPLVVEVYLGRRSSENIMEAKPEAAPEPKSATKGPPLLELRNIDLYYGLAQALFSVSLKVSGGEVIAILGTNGSGKSTLLRAISGVEKPSFGEIIFKGKQVPPGWPERAVEMGIQYVPQGHFIFPELSVKDNLKIGVLAFEKYGRVFKDELERVLHYFPSMKDVLNVEAGSLSGGQQQMLVIGQALMGKPELLMLDEPSLGLSPKLVESLFETIRKVSIEEGCTVIIVEQNVSHTLEISDYVYMLSSGVLVGEGSSKKLMESDSTIKRLLGFR